MRTTVPSRPAPSVPFGPVPSGPDPAWDARLAAWLLAIDPERLGGAVLRGPPGPARDAWLARLRALLPAAAPVRRVAPQIEDDRLLGGLDLAASLRAGRPILERGVLAEAHGGVLVLAMAERAAPGLVARLAAALDTGLVRLARDGLDTTLPSRFALLALDEGIEEEERVDPALADRLAFHLPLDGPDVGAPPEPPEAGAEIAAARARLARIEAPEALVEGLIGTAQAFGIDSLRAPLLALAAARGLAALAGRQTLTTEDAALAARLVLAPRATCVPVPAEPEPPAPEPPTPEDGAEEGRGREEVPGEVLLAAVRAALPAGLLTRLAAPGGERRRAGRIPTGGRSNQLRRDPGHGRPAGIRPGRPRGGARLALLATLRAAAPWQRLRRSAGPPVPGRRLLVRPQDLRVRRLLRPVRSTTLFLVDASGSTALHRLAEAKGAVELLLAECYVRRDRVALLAFRGERVELLLPPTRSLARARRELAALPGGGGTPLARALDAGLELALRLRRREERPLLVLLTDGRANLARDGTPGRERAEAEALAAARALRATEIAALVVDTGPRPEPRARALAEAAGARYLPLPRAEAASLARAVRAAVSEPHGRTGHG